MASYVLPNAIDWSFFFSFLVGGGGVQFSDKEFEASKLVICTYTGKCECRRRNIRWSHNSDAILVSLFLSFSTHMHIIVSSHFDTSTVQLLLLPLLLILLLALLMAG